MTGRLQLVRDDDRAGDGSVLMRAGDAFGTPPRLGRGDDPRWVRDDEMTGRPKGSRRRPDAPRVVHDDDPGRRQLGRDDDRPPQVGPRDDDRADDGSV